MNNYPFYEPLKKLLQDEPFDIDRFLNKVEFNLILQNSAHAKNFNMSEFIKELYELLLCLKKHEIPLSYSEILLQNFDIRKIIVALQGFSLNSKNWITPFAQWIGERRVLEVMSGLGALSSALRAEGISVIATDNYSATNFDFNELWTTLEAKDAISAIETHGANVDIIIMSWCYTDNLGYECLLKMREVNPDALMIFIGEEPNLSTGSPDLYESMIEVSDDVINEINAIYPRWHGVTDRLYLIK